MSMPAKTRPPCGVLVSRKIRFFCRRSSCSACFRHSVQRRSAVFYRQCSDAHGPFVRNFWVIIAAPLTTGSLDEFRQFKRRFHSALRYRRVVEHGWRQFGLLALFDGASVRGIAHLGNLGTDQLRRVIGPCEIYPFDPGAAHDIENILADGPTASAPEPLKHVFITAKPKPNGKARSWDLMPGIDDEPMAFVF